MISMHRSLLLPALLLALGVGCAEDLDKSADAADAAVEPTGFTDNGDGTFSITVDASGEDNWIYLRFAEGIVSESASWDLAFQRFIVRLNGGDGGDGAAVAVFAPDVMLDAATMAPDDGWATDAPDGDDAGEDPDRVFDTWYSYNPVAHTLSPKAGVWYTRTGDGESYYALRFDDYYDADGNSGFPSITFQPVAAPANPPPR